MKKIFILFALNFIFLNFAADNNKLTAENDQAYQRYLKNIKEAQEHIFKYLPEEKLVNLVNEYGRGRVYYISYEQWQKNNKSFIDFVLQCNLQKATELLESGEVDINAKDLNGSTALCHTADRGDTVMTKFLIDSGADVNAKNGFGYSPLMCAAGCYFPFKDKNGSVRHDPHGCMHYYIVDLLIKAGADIKTKNNNGETALMIASRYEHAEIIKLLIN